MIVHSVIFTLKHPAGSLEEAKFLTDALVLTQIHGVEHFERMRQVSPKNDFDFGFSMQFSDAAAYRRYDEHPIHVEFVRDRWVPEVAKFLEIDFEAL